MTAQFGNGGASSFTCVGGPAKNYLLNETAGWTVCGFHQPNNLDNNFHSVLTKTTASDTVRALGLYYGSSTFGNFSIPANCLIYFGVGASTWAVWTTSALTQNHWYFSAVTHMGTTSNLYSWDLTSPAGQMATASHSPGSQDTDTTSAVWDLGDDGLNLTASFRALDFAAWTGVIPLPELQALAYRTKQIDDVQPQNIIWRLPFDVSRKNSPPGHYSFLVQSRGIWSGFWKPSASNSNYSAVIPPVAGMPMDRANIIPIIMSSPPQPPSQPQGPVLYGAPPGSSTTITPGFTNMVVE